MVFQYHPHGGKNGDKVGWIPPILDLHHHVMVPSQLCPAEDPRARVFFTVGKSFSVDESKFPHGFYLAQFCKSHHDFMVVNRSNSGRDNL